MNRRILLQVTAPAILLGVLLLAACVAGAWYGNFLDRNLAKIRNESVISLQAAQELELAFRQIRLHSLLYLMDPSPLNEAKEKRDDEIFQSALDAAKSSVRSAEERVWLQEIDSNYRKYRKDLENLASAAKKGSKPMNLRELAREHPVSGLVEPCLQLLNASKKRMNQTFQDSDQVSHRARVALLFLGIGGPIGGILCGYGIARGLSRSIYQLSVRVQDMAHRLDQDNLASVSVAADGDLNNLDKQLQQVVQRVEQVAERAQRHQRDMLRAEQLSAVGQLAASVAHEVRNPLTSVKMLVEAALRPKSATHLTRSDLQVIHGEVVRLEQTVQGFLDFARLPTPRRSVVELRKVVDPALDLVRARARQQQVELRIDQPPDPVFVDVDTGQIHTVLVNLFLNALDAMPRGGTLEVRWHQPAPALRLIVCDTGPGIAPEMTERLFTPFASSKPTGTGLGLSICKRILEEHGGTITAANRPQGGACFTITLPASCCGLPAAQTGVTHAHLVGR